MNKYSGVFYVQSTDNDKIFVGNHVLCSFTSNDESGGCWRGELTRITSRGIYIDVGNKRDKYVCFADIKELEVTTGKAVDN